MDVTFMRRATAPVTMSGTAEEGDEGEEEKGGPAAGRRTPGISLLQPPYFATSTSIHSGHIQLAIPT